MTNDGGRFHIAQALSINTVGLFGPVDDLVYGRYFCQDKVVVLKNKNALQCRPCYQKFKFKGCDYDKACLREIGVEEVFEAAKRLIAKAK
ncbi:MAG: hypothetical protein KAS99_02660 [Candidatus Omnitrophica bacterium]|nr:hypothetical protein [Candidatus Omnitrophota bacterium]